jgi:hypothetical protein
MDSRRKRSVHLLFWRAVVEVGSILFLFYANLLMGEFERSNQAGKTLSQGFADILTVHNFEIAVVAAIVGFVVFETLRAKAAE